MPNNWLRYTVWQTVDDKEVEKIEKYLDLARELKKVWNMKVTVVPLEAGALGTPAKSRVKRLKTIGIETKIIELPKSVLIYTIRILWKVLEVWGVLLTLYLKNKTHLLVHSLWKRMVRKLKAFNYWSYC